MASKKMIKKQPFKSKICIVCGASTGIGKATAKEIVQLGGSVCVIARNLDNLNKAAEEMNGLKVNDSQFVEKISCDATDMEKLKPQLEGFVNKHGVPDYLINVVGYALPKYVEDYTFKEFKDNMDMNYHGQLVPTLIMLPFFMKAKEGHIAFVSSIAGFLGVMGYAAYCPTKFAIVGLADALRNELSPYNIDVSVLYPPDTETPAFEKENETKPQECMIMSERGGLLKPEEVAEPFIEGILKKKFYITPGESKFLWKMTRLFPNIVHNMADKELKKARKKIKKE